MDLGILSLSDLQVDPVTGRRQDPGRRVQDIVSYGILADRLGLDVVALGEHHTLDFAVSSPAVTLAAIAQGTRRIRLSSGVSVISALDPVRLHEDFAGLDLLSGGRAEIIAGRSAFVEPFDLFDVDLQHYDEIFAEKLDLLLQLRRSERVTWSGAYRPALRDAQIAPRPAQDELPVWVGVGGSPQSAMRAGRLGLPMMLGLIGGDVRGARAITDLYRRTAAKAGAPAAGTRLGVTSHLYIAETSQQAIDTFFPYYRQYSRPRGRDRSWAIDRDGFDTLAGPHGAMAVGSPAQVIDKLLLAHDTLDLDRFLGQVDLGGLPSSLVRRSIELFATEVAPAVRSALATRTTYRARERETFRLLP
ncbi:LLM class flavin-dependent oxidoreductase [Nakamurella sp. YIM 132087]|uniref:LLM class flavin-dependent oxidoreductase n=1 Tax=Nakamurella alba TaxID=2665158 RepID=A0A7K1FIP5_9ACTN|nr:LLM class flavin-dependent oxidoreductase [Nakamurella alba]MTD13319.1 LLM class flavin-dependent oxidoreductase [Nakamurella alba]